MLTADFDVEDDAYIISMSFARPGVRPKPKPKPVPESPPPVKRAPPPKVQPPPPKPVVKVRLWGHLFILIEISLTHWGRDKMAAISQTAFSSAFPWMKTFEFQIKFHWNMFLKGVIDNMAALVQIMAWHRSGDKPLSEPMMA